MANVVKDIGEIWTRLFDHRPFLNGEIRFFLQEFEEKRGNREVEKLFEILQNLTEIRYAQIDKIKLEGEANLQILKKKVDKSCEICNNILETEATYKQNSNLEKQKRIKKAELEVLVPDIAPKCTKFDEEYKE